MANLKFLKQKLVLKSHLEYVSKLYTSQSKHDERKHDNRNTFLVGLVGMHLITSWTDGTNTEKALLK